MVRIPAPAVRSKVKILKLANFDNSVSANVHKCKKYLDRVCLATFPPKNLPTLKISTLKLSLA